MAKISKSSGVASPKTGGSDDLSRLEKIFELMGRHSMAELEWERGDERLRVRTQAGMSRPAPITSGTSPATLVDAPRPAVEVPKVTVGSNQKQVVSPFVGTFYRAPSPTSDPYVREGQVIKRGDVLCIIEAMKLMNEIDAEFGGKVISVLVDNGQPVEFGEPLFLIEI
ncbi:acetyl-CoA carboxylase biotin carboxyl carrier protein [Bdellovibrionota bacterium FG-1]